jgi:hypothetical protein
MAVLWSGGAAYRPHVARRGIAGAILASLWQG